MSAMTIESILVRVPDHLYQRQMKATIMLHLDINLSSDETVLPCYYV